MNSTHWPENSFEDRSSVAYGVVAFLLFLSTISVSLRLWTRKMIHQFGVDDWAALLTLILIIACGISITQMTRYGLGRHGWALSLDDRILYQRSFFVSLVLYVVTLAVVKLTFLLQYYRILSVSRMRHIYMVMIVLVIIWGITQATFALVACIPLEGFWDPRVQAKCIPNAHIAWYISALFNILSDIIILVLPIPVIRKLNLPGSQKAFLIGIFSLGFLTVAISALRIKFLTLRPDPTWSNFDPTLWSLAELSSAITCACLATLKPLVTRLGNWFSRPTNTESVAQMAETEDNINKLFLLEGLLTLVIGIWSVFVMVPSPTQTKAPWRPKGWFTEHEEKIMVNRILRDDPSKSDMHNRQAITLKMLWESLCDYDLWPIYIIGLTFSIPAGPPDQYLTLSLRQLGFDTFDTNLLSIPCQVATTINMLILTWISEKVNQRALLGVFVEVWLLPCVIALAVIPSDVSRWATYALVVVLLSYPSPHPMQVGWASRNSNTVRTRTVSAALYNMSVQLQSIISANIYRRDDRPEYRRGNRVLAGVASLNIVIYATAKLYYVWRNKQRDRIWDAMSQEERQRYLDTTADKGSKRLDFRFAS
ncbi:major facilitator superfamily transporter [Colletotrichum karsti]|uniref:Major facilitator superfamily transporter n=1 Tax=Colletotrichum karsti TaxID=1095194 RepID=A0A9P6LGJ2_9PEZI|nr:major facilitator superfamily transporter [Colletotrichum karsti]KAF9872593.1 major facilitator superfamily transporter [Colletotrichum karsti]